MQEHRVVIAALTYQRPHLIKRLVPQLLEQARQHEVPTRVLIIDNDPSGSAHAACPQDALLTYVHEPRPGIAAGRNRALDEAHDDDVLIFIDDDEQPETQWLKELWHQYQVDRPAAVVGPVVPEYTAAIPGWIEAGRFFMTRRLPTGTAVTMAATNNLLIDLNFVRRHGMRFNEEFSESGGSDSMFTHQITQLGGRMVWCDEARVRDQIPAKRLTPHWVLMRVMRYGIVWSVVHVQTADGVVARWSWRCRLLGSGVARCLVGLARAGFGYLSGRQVDQARGLRTAMRGIGLVIGLTGARYREYSRQKARTKATGAFTQLSPHGGSSTVD